MNILKIIILLTFFCTNLFGQFYENVNDSVFVLKDTLRTTDPVTGQIFDIINTYSEDYSTIKNYKPSLLMDESQPHIIISDQSDELHLSIKDLKETKYRIDTLLYFYHDTTRTTDPLTGKLIDVIVVAKSSQSTYIDEENIKFTELNKPWIDDINGQKTVLYFDIDSTLNYPMIQSVNIDNDKILLTQFIIKKDNSTLLYKYNEIEDWSEIIEVLESGINCYVRTKIISPMRDSTEIFLPDIEILIEP